MLLKAILGSLIFLISCAGSQSTLEVQTPPGNNLLIENGINRGTRYTDSSGQDWIITYISVVMTNEGQNNMDLNVEFLNEYEHPNPESDASYRIVLLSKDWALNGAQVTDSMISELNAPKLKLTETLEPEEELVVTIGTIRQVPANCSPIPNALLVQSCSNVFHTCDNLMEHEQSNKSQTSLGIRINYCENRCMIVPCGQVSYSSE